MVRWPNKHGEESMSLDAFLILRAEHSTLAHRISEKIEQADLQVSIATALDDPYDLGKEFFKWEIATAIAGWCIKINPFDQPNVESAKVLAREMVRSYQESGVLETGEPAFSSGKLQFFGDISSNDIDYTR